MDAYERGRPGYPLDAALWLTPEASGLVVEVGAGTGKLTRALAGAGRHVLAVEPDERMRAVLDALSLPGVESVSGSAESVPLEDQAACAVVSGSSFHWFDLDAALCEAARLLVPGGTLAFAWNRPDHSVAWVRRMSEAMRRGQPWRGNRPWAELVAATGLFEPLEQAGFPHVLALSVNAIGDYVRSYSRVGMLPEPEREAAIAQVRSSLRAEPGLEAAEVLEMPFVVTAYRTRLASTSPGSRGSV